MEEKMKTVRVCFCDGFGKKDDVFLPILRRHYNVVLTKDDPEYVIYSVFGHENLRYPSAVRIFTTGEAVTPDFNSCDYATGFDYLEFGDRYLRLPLCSIMFRNGVNMLDLAMKRGSDLRSVDKPGFCSFVVSNGGGMPERRMAFEMLSAYKRVDAGGAYLNNVGGRVADKREFEHAHKFALCFENERYPGYCTEKLVDAFASGAIPIYFGDPRVGEMFNTKAFVNVGDYASLDEAVESVKSLDGDDVYYAAMKEESILAGPIPGLAELEIFLCSIFDQEMSSAHRRPASVFARQWIPRSPARRIGGKIKRLLGIGRSRS